MYTGIAINTCFTVFQKHSFSSPPPFKVNMSLRFLITFVITWSFW